MRGILRAIRHFLLEAFGGKVFPTSLLGQVYRAMVCRAPRIEQRSETGKKLCRCQSVTVDFIMIGHKDKDLPDQRLGGLRA